MKRAVCSALVAALVCSACNTTPTATIVASSRSAMAARVVTPLAQLQYAPVTLGTPMVANLDEQSSVVALGDRITYARGYALPDPPGSLAVAVTASRGGYAQGGAIVYPHIVWLDATFNVIGSVQSPRVAYRPSALGAVITLDAFADTQVIRARYLLLTERDPNDPAVAMTQQNSTTGIPLVIPVAGGLFMWHIQDGTTATPVRVLASPTGALELMLTRYQPRRITP